VPNLAPPLGEVTVKEGWMGVGFDVTAGVSAGDDGLRVGEGVVSLMGLETDGRDGLLPSSTSTLSSSPQPIRETGSTIATITRTQIARTIPSPLPGHRMMCRFVLCLYFTYSVIPTDRQVVLGYEMVEFRYTNSIILVHRLSCECPPEAPRFVPSVTVIGSVCLLNLSTQSNGATTVLPS